MGSKMMCFDCLQRRINADLSDEITFCYGLSESHLPFGNSAVIQVSNSEAGEKSEKFVVVYLPSDHYGRLTQFVDECISQDQSGSEGYVNNGLNPVGRDFLEIDGEEALETLTKQASRLGSLGSFDWDYSGRFSITRIIGSLAPHAQCGISSLSTFKEIVASFLSGSLEDQILDSLDNLITGKTTRVDCISFLSLIGIPSFNERSFPGCIRHPNIVPCLGMLKTPGYVKTVFPMTPYTLKSILHFSPDALKSDWHIRFLLYQLLSALAYMHGLGVAHGNLSPSSVMLTKSCWVWLQIYDKLQSGTQFINKDDVCPGMQKLSCCLDSCASQCLYADLKLSVSVDWRSSFNLWWKGEMSNFEYLLILNKLAGRRWGDHTFHPVMPWVIDFSSKPAEDSDAGWRDLSKSKWRLAKGDEQLDFTYLTSEIPHHVSDECLSELAVCSYKARRLPLHVLRLAVRSVYEPNEYPSTMQRLYQWTPDECIPEFYCDPDVFLSLHSGMADLAVPQWANGPKEFIELHREALESKRVPSQIHHWIDITFGYKMSGQAAVSAKNVMLHSADSTFPQSEGRRQLFTLPHPVRRGVTCVSSETYLVPAINHSQVTKLGSHTSSCSNYLGELEEVSKFAGHASHLSPIYSYHSESSEGGVPSASTPAEKNSVSYAPDPSYSCCSYGFPSDMNFSNLLDYVETDDESSSGYQDYILWKQKSSRSPTFSKKTAVDIFSFGCILAELYLRRPLFDQNSLTAYLERGVLPSVMGKLHHHIKILVEACISTDWSRRPSVKCLLESPYFTNTVRSCYLFLAPFQLLATDGSCLPCCKFCQEGGSKRNGNICS